MQQSNYYATPAPLSERLELRVLSHESIAWPKPGLRTAPLLNLTTLPFALVPAPFLTSCAILVISVLWPQLD